MPTSTILLLLLLLIQLSTSIQQSIDLVPKLIRRPTHLDHYLCRQLHNGIGLRAIAVTNLSGDVCRTYCRVMDRMGGKIYYTENISPNFVRCGLYQARCVDGQCIGHNFPVNNNNNNNNQMITSSVSILSDNNDNDDGDNISNNDNNDETIDKSSSIESIDMMKKSSTETATATTTTIPSLLSSKSMANHHQ
ncbi:hypothetical protein DERP_007894 [Dermatophagoides pteronyssinus]|uniref:Uncharacterized protein n=1 Tax=Dermatophagoides pteronyssinus TaxID=6956 RepID=A0ABQ8ISY3_DERPT|nr:hypothetical protein DERP_007894 [Dermatophagoides pteronyssinus]